MGTVINNEKILNLFLIANPSKTSEDLIIGHMDTLLRLKENNKDFSFNLNVIIRQLKYYWLEDMNKYSLGITAIIDFLETTFSLDNLKTYIKEGYR